MAGRALVFSDPQIIEQLRLNFVPYAGDQWYLHRQKDEDGKFFWAVAQQGHYKDNPEDSTRQGIYIAGADGSLLRSDHFRPSPERMREMMGEALADWKARPHPDSLKEETTLPDATYRREPPNGGLILDVFTRIPQKRTFGNPWTPNHATGRDHMWVTREEARSLLPPEWRKGMKYPLPPSVQERLLRFHLVDNVRGEPPMWGRDEIRESDLTLTVEDAAGRLRLEGSAKLRHASDRGYDARLQGILTYDRAHERFSRFDLLAWGEFWGEGTYTKGAPQGKFPLVIAASLAEDAPADRIPPQGSRNLNDYFGKG